MAKVPSLPSNGQPIDTQYIYDIVNSLISINSQLNQHGTSNIRVGSSGPGGSTVDTSSANFDAQSQPVLNAAIVKKNAPQTGQINFATTFTKTPVVTLTLVSRGSSTTVRGNVVITAIDTTSVYYKIEFDSDGTATFDLNLIAIGV